MKSYIEQLQEQATPTNEKLVKFFTAAGVPTSTYYRAMTGTDLRYSTALKVSDAITSYALHNPETSDG